MNKSEYADYEKRVANFFEQEKLENLSGGRITCPDCGAKLHTSGLCDEQCNSCGMSYDMMNEPSFSWHSCDCCGSSLGGSRYPASGYSRELNECFEYDVCVDCLYYATYGQLDDQTMMDIEESNG